MTGIRPAGFTFGPQVCGDLGQGATREWLVADGRGGYAMGTVSGLRTRRYHALLVVAGDTPASRMVGLAALDPVLSIGGGEPVRLGTHEWSGGAIAPSGHELLARFDLVDGLPRWRWRVGDVVLERELATRHGQSCVAVVHRLIAGGGADRPVRLTLEALCTWRDSHGERGAGSPMSVEPVVDGAVVEGAYRLRGPRWQPDGTWLLGVHHRLEAARGYPSSEDLLLAGRFTGVLSQPGDTVEVTAWAGDLAGAPPPAAQIVDAARQRRREVVALAAPADATTATLALAADAFIVETANGPDVVAGYPWFGAWSRDTMTSYQGLFLATGRADQGRELLRHYAGTLSEGMLANTADGGSVGYNTADATLWFLHAVERHVGHTDDTDLAAELLPALDAVLAAHVKGTRYGIAVDPSDGLLTQGAEGEALTWMDARVDGVPVTRRAGKAVDINALWCNGLAALASLHERTGSASAAQLWRQHQVAVSAFRRRFVSPLGHLYDTVEPADAALRPNQLLAFSLPHAPMEPDRQLVIAIGTQLLTPLGPRSLAPDAPMFRPSHHGTLADRDRAYHQGTVWPWLIGPYADALAANGTRVPGLLDGLVAHLSEYGVGSVSETADGAAPHRATGCPFQAWSVAELLRVWRVDQREGFHAM